MNNSTDSKPNGYWGNPTATIDWCEVNYEITHYIAEFWNTISNLLMILLPLYGLYWSLKLRFKYNSIKKQNKTLNLNPFNTNNLNIPFTIISCHIGLMIVGIGSWFFHMTLLYSMQLLDEIPMLWASCLIIYANYDLIHSTFDRKNSKKYKILKYFVLFSDIAFCVGVSYVYVYYLTNPIFHEICYGIQVGVVICENIYLIHKLKLSPRLYLLSFIYYILGFILWNIDNNLCNYLKMYRSSIDYYIQTINDTFTTQTFIATILTKSLNSMLILLKSLSEFHSLWHLFTGYGAYLTILFLLDAYYENHLLKCLKKVESTPSLKHLHDTIKKPHELKRLHNRPVKSNMYRLLYNLDHDYIKSDGDKIRNKNK